MHASRWIRRVAALTALGAGLIPGVAVAQTRQTQSIDLPKFDPAPAGDRFFGVPSPYAPGRSTFHGGLVLDYGHDPLVLVDGDDEAIGHVVEHQLFLHLNVAFAILNRIEINADMPFALVNAGDGAVVGGPFAFESPNEAGIGDLRLGARVRLFGGYHDAFQIGLGGYVWLPTASDNAFLGSGTRGQAQVLVGGRVDRFLYTTMIGPTFRASEDVGNVTLGHQFNWGGGVGYLIGPKKQFQVSVETTGGVTLEEASDATTNAELLVGAKYRVIAPIELGVGVGPGFARGVGTPDFRGVLSVFYTPEIPVPVKDTDGDGIGDDVDACPTVKGLPSPDPKKHGCPPPADRDRDGILDPVDACPDEPGRADPDPKKNGCPIRDTDKDGIFDDVDACITEYGVANTDPKKHGCPVRDKDGDTIEDDVDACPTIPGVASTDPQQHGCPPDTDGDGFRDDVDACPREKGVDDPDPTKKGCPKLVRVTDTEIIILEQVQFDFGLSTIRKESDPLLDSVAAVMKEHPEITLIEVQGHTDNKGSKALNAGLSESRAKAVMEALVKRGIDGTRMTYKGYGDTVPIGDNKTDEGRQKNRRVQFVVKEKKKLGDLTTPTPTPTPPTTPTTPTPPTPTTPTTPTPAPTPTPTPKAPAPPKP